MQPRPWASCWRICRATLTIPLSGRMPSRSEDTTLFRSLEAFQTMSAFLIHDLKNAASTLGLMLENLPGHFDNPAFRQDAFPIGRHDALPISGGVSNHVRILDS